MKKIISAVIAGITLFGCATSGTAKVKASKTTFAADALKRYVDSGELPGYISVFYKKGVQETACVGWANVEKKMPITMDNPFMQCSQTKGFCGVTVAMLVEDGKISLDDPVSKYLPEFKSLKIRHKTKGVIPAENILTVRMVMNHTGGFPFEIPTKVKKGWCALGLRESAREAAANPLLFEPGTQVKYSNTGIDIGAAIVEVVSGKPWEVFLKERVFEPLGMKNSTFQPTDEMLANSIAMYSVQRGKKAVFKEYDKWMPTPHNGPTVFPSAGAGLWTTANDQLKFYKMLMNLGVGENGVRILKEETVKKLLAASTRPGKLGGYSLGLVVGRSVMGHGGAWGTKCNVDWQKKQLTLFVVQVVTKSRFWIRDINNAANKFFQSNFDSSGTDAYTGRTK